MAGELCVTDPFFLDRFFARRRDLLDFGMVRVEKTSFRSQRYFCLVADWNDAESALTGSFASRPMGHAQALKYT